MCGITGFWGPPDAGVLAAMTEVICHRGPDDRGDYETDVASLGFRRLAIIDLVGGHQPMVTEDGLVHLVYNGEVYNYRELRGELEAAGQVFTTVSDSEVVLRAYVAWGPAAFARFNGMWALAILDRREEPRLVLSRDHFGIKPLYVAEAGGRLLFASEIKSLLHAPDVAAATAPDEQWVHDYLVAGVHDHRPETAFRGVRNLPPATYAIVSAAGIEETRYWTPRVSSDGSADPAEFRRLFELAVERRLVADVPVGTCLSGGLDSSSIVSVMSRLLAEHVPDATSMGERLKVFSAVFDGDPIDEREYIDVVLDASGAEPHWIRPTSQQFVDELDRLVWHQEEPIVSTGPYAQWCVMREARGEVTVLLDGQGGDELLAGYVPYQVVYLRQLWRERRWRTLTKEAWAARDVVGPLVRRRLADRRRRLELGKVLRPAFRKKSPPSPRSDDLKERLLQDLTTFSLPSLLRYEDRNSMAHALESRVPFLDQELVDYVLALPADAIIRGGWSRAILRDGLTGVLPEKVRLRRWKVGFTTPETRWLRARRAVLQSLFRSPAFCARPYWDGLAVAEAFDAACRGEVEWSQFFWRAVNVELWLRVFFTGDGDTRGGAAPEADFRRVGDEHAADLAGTKEAALALAHFRANWGRHLIATGADGRSMFLRAPVRTPLVTAGDDLVATVADALRRLDAEVAVRAGDLIAVSEKAVAASQGRSFPVDDVRPRPLARFLSRFVKRTASGIGLGIPATMELALQEAGTTRILAATAASAVTRPLGIKGTFYRVAGARVAAIDGPTAGTIPPYNTHAKLPPADPDGVAARLAEAVAGLADGPVSVAIIDANDIGAVVLGATPDVDRPGLVALLRDNPLGQGEESTPVLLVRPVGKL
jgi:asparagine synthase (glutamine-hydrolysing)